MRAILFFQRRRRQAPAPAARLFDLAALASGRRVDNEAVIRGLCANAYLGDRTALCRVLGRYKIFVDTTDIGHSSHLMLDGYWEMWVTEAMAAMVKPGMIAADVGANLGYFTLLMAERVGPGGFVHAFEPNPAIVARLRRSVSINGFASWTTIYEAALSDLDGHEVELMVPADEPKNAYIVPAERGPGEGPRLRTQRLDGFVGLDRVDFIKIDADTAEETIWRGAQGIFETRRPMTIFLEFAPARYADPAAFLAEIRAQGFALHQIHVDGLRSATAEDILGNASPFDDRMLALCR